MNSSNLGGNLGGSPDFFDFLKPIQPIVHLVGNPAVSGHKTEAYPVKLRCSLVAISPILTAY